MSKESLKNSINDLAWARSDMPFSEEIDELAEQKTLLDAGVPAEVISPLVNRAIAMRFGSAEGIEDVLNKLNSQISTLAEEHNLSSDLRRALDIPHLV